MFHNAITRHLVLLALVWGTFNSGCKVRSQSSKVRTGAETEWPTSSLSRTPEEKLEFFEKFKDALKTLNERVVECTEKIHNSSRDEINGTQQNFLMKFTEETSKPSNFQIFKHDGDQVVPRLRVLNFDLSNNDDFLYNDHSIEGDYWLEYENRKTNEPGYHLSIILKPDDSFKALELHYYIFNHPDGTVAETKKYRCEVSR